MTYAQQRNLLKFHVSIYQRDCTNRTKIKTIIGLKTFDPYGGSFACWTYSNCTCGISSCRGNRCSCDFLINVAPADENAVVYQASRRALAEDLFGSPHEMDAVTEAVKKIELNLLLR